MQKQTAFKIILSRTDSIGDVVLTLPMAGVLKNNFPNCKIIFLGRTYTKAVVDLCEHVDAFINYDELLQKSKNEQITFLKALEADAIVHVLPVKKIAFLAKAACIKTRVGSKSRFYHWFTCNALLSLPRKNSNLHEAQLNIKLLSFLKINTSYALNTINGFYGFTKIQPLGNELFLNSIDTKKIKVIIHPKSKGSAREWGLNNFAELIACLPTEKYQIFISGTKEDGVQLESFIQKNTSAIDITGKLTLSEFIAFINLCDVLVAASTGPLHIAAALNKKAIGLFAPMKPIHPGRWAPLGEKASFLVLDKSCNDCKNGSKCKCIEAIEVKKVVNLINEK